MACVELHDAATVTLKSKDLATHGFQKNSRHPLKPAEAEPSFRKVNLLL